MDKNEIYNSIKKQILAKIEIISIEIIIQKCKSKKNNYNKIVDNMAKKRSKHIDIEQINPKFISYEMIKKENKNIYNNIKIQRWYNYIDNTDYSVHFKKYNINIEDYHSDDLLFMTSTETSILLKLYSSHIELNHYLFYKLKKIDTPLCKWCNQNETLNHYLFDCKHYINLIKIRDTNIKEILIKSNLNNIKIDYPLICYSNKCIKQDIRIKIKKIIIKYIINTDRFKKNLN